MPRLSKVVVMGAGGYVGARLVRTLIGDGRTVRAVVREPVPWLDVDQTVTDLADPDPDELRRVCDDADAVVHLAGENELFAARQPAAALASTVVATEKVAEACVAAGVARLVYLSTVHVYGARIEAGATLDEAMRVEPRSAYAISRLASEHVAASLGGGHYDLVVLRLTNSVGAPEDARIDRWSLVANDLCRQGARTGALTLRSSGMQWRDFVPLGAVCGAISVAARRDGPVPSGTFNLASSRPTTVRALAEAIQAEFELQTGTRPELRAPDPEPDPPAAYRVSVERGAAHGLGVDVPLSDAVAETVRFCLDHQEELPGE